jgi:hypothetical protein
MSDLGRHTIGWAGTGRQGVITLDADGMLHGEIDILTMPAGGPPSGGTLHRFAPRP